MDLTWLRDPRLLVGAATAVGGFVLYVQEPGRSLVSALQEIQRVFGSITLSPDQERMVAIIASEANRAGFGWLTVAAVVNAYAESRLNPLASGDGGHSIGLFQLHDKGAGTGMSLAARLDPAQNSERIFDEVRGGNGATIRGMKGHTNMALTRAFARDIERCYECGHAGGDTQLYVREKLCVDLYGDAIARQNT